MGDRRFDDDLGRYPWGRLFRQFHFELVQQQLLVAGRIGAPGQDEMPPVSGRQMHIDHLHGGELLQDRPGRQSRGVRSGQVFQRHMQAVGDEGDKDVRLDPILALMEDRPDGQIVLQFLERLLQLAN